MIMAAAAAVLALPVSASAAYGDQPALQNGKASVCGSAHGTFGYLGENGNGRHGLGMGDTSETGSQKLGADGPATGAANSAACHS